MKRKINKRKKKAVIKVDFSTLARVCGEDVLREVLEAKGKRKGSSIIIPGRDLLPVLAEILKHNRKW